MKDPLPFVHAPCPRRRLVHSPLPELARTATSPFLHAAVAIGSCVAIGYAASLAFGAVAQKKDLRGLTLWDRP